MVSAVFHPLTEGKTAPAQQAQPAADTISLAPTDTAALVRHDSPESIYAELSARAAAQGDPRLVVTFPVELPASATPHAMRHSFATHLLEDGMDILSIKNLLGHESIDTTLIYLQIAQLSTQKLFSPLDTLFSEFGKK